MNDIARPKIRAWSNFSFPRGRGLKQVLLINLSVSDSYHMFRAPAAPAPIATKKSDKTESIKGIFDGAITNPTSAVKITRDMTLGFINS